MSFLFLARLEGERKACLRRIREGCRVRLTQIALRFFKRLKKSLLLWKLKKSNPLLCCFLEPLTTKYCRVWGSVINFVDRFHEVGEESSLYQGEDLIIMTSKSKSVRDMMLPYWPYLAWRFYLLYGSIKLLS